MYTDPDQYLYREASRATVDAMTAQADSPLTKPVSPRPVLNNSMLRRAASSSTAQNFDGLVTGNDRKRFTLVTRIERAGFWEYVQAKCPQNTTHVKFANHLGRMLFGHALVKSEDKVPEQKLGAFLDAGYAKACANFKFTWATTLENASQPSVVTAGHEQAGNNASDSHVERPPGGHGKRRDYEYDLWS